MKPAIKNILFIPVWLSLLIATGCFYWGYKFHTAGANAEKELSALEAEIKKVECPTVDKDVVLKIARRSNDVGQGYGNIISKLGMLFLVIGILNFSIVSRHIKKPQ